MELLVVFIGRRGFQLRVRQRRGIEELLARCPPAAEPLRKQTYKRRTLVFWHNCVSVALSFCQTVHHGTCDEEIILQSTLIMHVCFSKGKTYWEQGKGLGNWEANHYRTEMPVHEHKQKERWDKKRKLQVKPLNLKQKESKKQWERERPGNSR